jgi:hypothetical protein
MHLFTAAQLMTDAHGRASGSVDNVVADFPLSPQLFGFSTSDLFVIAHVLAAA